MYKKIILYSCITLLSIGYTLAQSGNTMLWRINPPGGGPTSYLFGTIHLPRLAFLNFSDSVYNALNKVTHFYGEVDYLNVRMEMMNPDDEAYYAGKLSYLDSVSKTESWSRMVQRLNRQYGIQLKPDSLSQIIEFGTKRSIDLYKPDHPEAGIMDIMLTGYAADLGYKTGGIEKVRLQIGMLYDVIAARLTDSTINFDDETALMVSLSRNYIGQRLDSVQYFIASLNPTYRDIIFYSRNRTMADSIALHAKDKKAFFAIGCGHLPGDSGVIAQLKSRGYNVVPVQHGGHSLSLVVVNNIVKAAKKAAGKEKADVPKGIIDEEVSTIPIEEQMEVVSDISVVPAKASKKNVKKKTKTTKRKK